MLIIAGGVLLGLVGFHALTWLTGTHDGRLVLGVVVKLAAACALVLLALALIWGAS